MLLIGNRSEESVSDLVRRAQGGDRAAFDDLVRSYYNQIYRWALGITADSDDADDVVQEVLVRLLKRLNSYAGKSRFSTWLFQVTRNAALEQQRRRTRRRRLLNGFLRREPNEPTVEGNQLEQLQATHVVGQIRTLFEQLPERQRQIFDLVDLQGHSPTEIGEMLGMNAVTVRANLCKARRAIREKILEQTPALAEEVRT